MPTRQPFRCRRTGIGAVVTSYGVPDVRDQGDRVTFLIDEHGEVAQVRAELGLAVVGDQIRPASAMSERQPS
jgi:hypothetical protein